MTLTTRALILIALLFALATLLQTLRLSAAESRADAEQLRAVAAASASSEWEATAYTVIASLTQCQAQWADVQQRGATALAQAQRHRDIALNALDQWRARWDARNSDCSSALTALDAACTALEDY